MQRVIIRALLFAAIASGARAQPPKTVVFAVLFCGEKIESIAFLENRKLVAVGEGDVLAKAYYSLWRFE